MSRQKTENSIPAITHIWHYLFSNSFKSLVPNQANKSNDKSSIVRPKKNLTMPSTKQEEGNAPKPGKGTSDKGGTGSTSKGRKLTASGGAQPIKEKK